MITISQNPSTIASPSGQTLLIRFLTLEKDLVVVLYDVSFTSTADVNAKFVTNLGRAITEKLSVRMQGQEVQSLSLYGEYWGIRDMYLTKAQRSTISRPQQECDDMAEQGNINLLCCNANAASATGTNAAIATVFGKNPSQFCTP